MGLLSFIGRLFSQNARYNHDLYKSGAANKNIKVYTTVGWELDPCGHSGQTADSGNDRVGVLGCDTPSGNVEYHRPAYPDWDDTDRP